MVENPTENQHGHGSNSQPHQSNQDSSEKKHHKVVEGFFNGPKVKSSASHQLWLW